VTADECTQSEVESDFNFTDVSDAESIKDDDYVSIAWYLASYV